MGAVLATAVIGDGAKAAFLSQTFPLMFWTFVPGMLIAAVEGAAHPALAHAGRRWVPVVALGLVWIGLVSGLDPWLNVGVVIGAALLVAWIVVRGPRVPRWIGAFALISYGFYLWQYDVIERLRPPGLAGIGLIAFALCATPVAAPVSYILVERPSIGAGRWLAARAHRPGRRAARVRGSRPHQQRWPESLLPQPFRSSGAILASVSLSSLTGESDCPPATGTSTPPVAFPALRAERRPFDSIEPADVGRPRRREPLVDPVLALGLHRAWWDGYGANAHEETLVVVSAGSAPGATASWASCR